MDIAVPVESKALRLARYLREFVGLRSTTVSDVDKYETVLWFGDMPNEPECSSPAWNEGLEPGGPWLEVRKQQFPRLWFAYTKPSFANSVKTTRQFLLAGQVLLKTVTTKRLPATRRRPRESRQRQLKYNRPTSPCRQITSRGESQKRSTRDAASLSRAHPARARAIRLRT